MNRILREWVLPTVCMSVVVLAGLLTTVASAQGKKSSLRNLPQETVSISTTLEGLQTAYHAESNSSALYAAYAKKADEDGYGQLASMFRAISRGESIHADNCAALIRQMGETPVMKLEPIIVLSTRENLEAADATQRYEADVMYPPFIEQARKDKNEAAERTFRNSMAAEPAHHALFQQAIKDLDGYKGGHVDFFVCPSCGHTVRSLKGSECPVCDTPNEKYEKVN